MIANANTTARLLALHRAMRRGNVERAYRLAYKLGFGPGFGPDSLWETAVARLTGSIYGYAQADVLAGLPNQVKQAPSFNWACIPR